MNKRVLIIIFSILIIIGIVFIVNKNTKQENKKTSENKISVENVANDNIANIKTNLLGIDDINIEGFQFSRISTMQLNNLPMLHFYVTNNTNEETKNIVFIFKTFDNKQNLIDEIYVNLPDIKPNEKKDLAVKLNVDQSKVKNVTIKKANIGELYILDK